MVVSAIGTLASLHDATQLELSQPAAEQRPGHPRHAPVQIIEGSAAPQQFAQDQRGPALGEYLSALGQRTVLPVALSHVRPLRSRTDSELATGRANHRPIPDSSTKTALVPGSPTGQHAARPSAIQAYEAADLSRRNPNVSLHIFSHLAQSVATHPVDTHHCGRRWLTGASGCHN